MYLEKIEIPAFRVLRDVTLEFGELYDPQVFPLGSENGGGKSTLLQLVFTLLHCSANPKRHTYLGNLLASHSFEIDVADDECVLAKLTVRIGERSHALEFVVLYERFLAGKLAESPRFGFATRRERARNREKLRMAIAMSKRKSPEIARLEEEEEGLHADLERIKGLMTALDYHAITSFKPTALDLGTCGLICRSRGETPSDVSKILAAASREVFLLGPSNQQYLFLSMNTRKSLLGASPPTSLSEESQTPRRPQINYLIELEQAEKTMAGFYAYDWLSVKPLVQLFELAMKEDFKNVVKTGGYGSNYQSLESEVNRLLVGKKVRPLPDLSGVEFIIDDENGHETALGPEDLSQGELKRLMIFAWLRAHSAVDALVLIDEIELSLHPDWQVGIVRDLQEWAPKNQYILATHSYELCQAVTPRHVRELKPRLRSGEAEDSGSGHG